jgi:hypothetical protein
VDLPPLGLPALSLELNVEWLRWFAGAQALLSGASGHAARVEYLGARVGVFATEHPGTLFLSAGIGYLHEANIQNDAGSRGLGLSAEVGVIAGRDRVWYHPELVFEVILPVAQKKYDDFGGSIFFEPGTVFGLTFRLLF